MGRSWSPRSCCCISWRVKVKKKDKHNNNNRYRVTHHPKMGRKIIGIKIVLPEQSWVKSLVILRDSLLLKLNFFSDNQHGLPLTFQSFIESGSKSWTRRSRCRFVLVASGGNSKYKRIWRVLFLYLLHCLFSIFHHIFLGKHDRRNTRTEKKKKKRERFNTW